MMKVYVHDPPALLKIQQVNYFLHSTQSLRDVMDSFTWQCPIKRGLWETIARSGCTAPCGIIQYICPQSCCPDITRSILYLSPLGFSVI